MQRREFIGGLVGAAAWPLVARAQPTGGSVEVNETPIAAAIADCVMSLSRSNTIWMRWRCAAGIFQRSTVFNSRIWRLVPFDHLSPQNQMIKRIIQHRIADSSRVP